MRFGVWLVMFAVEQVAGPAAAGIRGRITTVPAALWGLGFSILGYVLGQWRASAKPRHAPSFAVGSSDG